MDASDKNLRFVLLEKATIPPNGLIEHFKDCYWIVHPEKGVVYWKHSPQCNKSEEITKNIAKSLYSWVEIKFIPSIFRSINPNDYC